MYSISKRTVLLMDFHYSMLLRVSVCYTLQYINNGKYLSKTEWILNNKRRCHKAHPRVVYIPRNGVLFGNLLSIL